MKRIAIVLAVNNEEANLIQLYTELSAVVNSLAYDVEILFVDDGSTDNSVSIIRDLMKNDDRVKLIKLTRNFGHQLALSAGMEHATADAIISLDADLQDPPSLIPQLIKEWEKGFKVVYAQRDNYRKDNYLKRIMTRIYYKLIHRIQGVKIPQNVGDYRLIDNAVRLELLKLKERSRYIRGMIAWLGYQAAFVSYKRKDREEGKSSYGIRKLFSLGMDGLISFSMIPLRFGLYLGFISILLGLGFFSYMILDIIINDVYYHLYKFLVNIIFIFMGFMFILIWILGEYIGRTYKETKNRSLYVVESTENFTEK
jgi:dolichol-phosphate mannosyltransferase